MRRRTQLSTAKPLAGTISIKPALSNGQCKSVLLEEALRVRSGQSVPFYLAWAYINTLQYSRTQWQGDEDSVKKISALYGKMSKEGYVNVAEELGLSGRRGTLISLFSRLKQGTAVY